MNKNNTNQNENTNKRELLPPPPLQESILIEKDQGKGGLKLDFHVLLSFSFKMKNVSEKEKDMYINLLQETFKENLIIIRKDVTVIKGVLDNSVELAVKSSLEKAKETKELIDKINENFINHYIKDESKAPKIKFSIGAKIDANQIINLEDYYFQNIMFFGDLLTTNLPAGRMKDKEKEKEIFNKAISNEWANYVFINPKYKDKFQDYENILKVFEKSRHTKVVILDSENSQNNIFEVKLDIFKNFNYIYSFTSMIEAQGEEFYSSEFRTGYICLTRNAKREITGVINRHFNNKNYLAYQYLNLVLKNIGQNWIVDRFVELNNKIFNSDIKLVDRILKRTITIDQEFLGKIDRRKNNKFGKKGGDGNKGDKRNNRYDSENQTYQPFKNSFDTKDEGEDAPVDSTPIPDSEKETPNPLQEAIDAEKEKNTSGPEISEEESIEEDVAEDVYEAAPEDTEDTEAEDESNQI